jgi:hypothetical protein
VCIAGFGLPAETGDNFHPDCVENEEVIRHWLMVDKGFKIYSYIITGGRNIKSGSW